MPVHNKNQGAGIKPAPAQTLAIEHAFGPIQVLAGPGSGKTYLTIRRIRHLICHHGISPNKILVITFTKAAATEMEERFIKLTKEEIKGVAFGTFHAVYYHILKKSGYGQGRLAIASGQDKWNYLKHVLNLYGIKDMDRELAGILLKEISYTKNRGGTIHMPVSIGRTAMEEDVLQKTFPAIYKDYCEIMKEENKLDFDDMIYLCSELLEKDAQLCQYWQKVFSHILVDEFQDISPLQYQVLKKLADPEQNLFVVGDDDQSIYGFRGAGPDIMKQFMLDYPHATQIFMEHNYRSDENIVNAASILIAENQNRFKKHITAKHPSLDKLLIHSFPTKEAEDQYLIERLKKLPLEQLEDTAVICRTNMQLAGISRQLSAAQLPFSCKDRVENIFEHFIARDLIAYLQFAICLAGEGKGKRGDFVRIMNKPCRYIQRCALMEEYVTPKALLDYYNDKPYMQTILRALFMNFKQLAALRPYLAIDYIRKAMGYNLSLCENRKKEEQKQLMEKADEIQETAKKHSSLRAWLDYISEYSESLKEADLKNEEKGIRLLTMHSSKGLEFENVFLPYISAKNIPNRKARAESQIEEERRIFYVAMTRAKARLEILYEKEPSPFLTKLAQSPYVEVKE